MAQEIPFHNQQASGLDEIGGGSPFAFNVVIDPANKTVRRRPGVATLSEAPDAVIDATGISGVYKTIGGTLYAVGNTPGQRKVFRVAGGASTNLSADLGGSLISGSGRPDFAETEMLLAIAGGEYLHKVELDGHSVSRLGEVETPAPKSSHIIANSQRLVANDVDEFRGHIRGSDLAQGTQTFAGHENWTDTVTDTGGSITVTAEAKTDAVVSLHENTNEIFAFGTTTLQVFAPDPQFGYVPVATREVGCSAAYSVIKIDQEFAWLDHLRRFVISDGRGFSVISDPIKATLSSIADVSDCFGYRVLLNNIDCMVWTFPTDGRTFVFQKGSGWGQWQGWNPAAANWTQFPVLSHFQEPGTGINIVGTTTGRVGQLSMGAFEDIGDFPIVARVATGYIDRGTPMRKACKRVTLKFRRGDAETSNEPTGAFRATLRWRDKPGPWSDPLFVSLGNSTDRDAQWTRRSLGVYRERQWLLEYSGEADMVLISADEEFEVNED